MKTSTSRTGASRTDSGFTILEFLIVICIAGIMSASLAIWMDNTFGRSELVKTMAQLESELGRAASLARQTGRDQLVRIKPTDISTDFEFKDKVVRIADPVKAGWVAAAEVGSSEELATIVFFGAGGSSGGTLELTDGPQKASISVDWLTARVRIMEQNP